MKSIGHIVLDFGKHNGTQLRDIPRKYLEWLRDEGVERKVDIGSGETREAGYLAETELNRRDTGYEEDY